MTFVLTAAERAVSETTLAATWALQSVPKEKAPIATRKVAP